MKQQSLSSGLTVRAFLLAMFATVIMAFWTQHSELVIDSPSFNSIHPSVAGFFAVICISLFINPVLKAIRGAWALKQSEMLLIYSILIVTGPVVSIGGVHFFLPTLIAPYYYATPENEYAELFHHAIPSWFGPKETEVIRQFYEGAEGTGVPWAFWIKPLVLWTPFLLAVYFIFLCMNVIIRRQWTDREKLTFPLVSLPLKITMNAESSWHFNRFFRNRLMWIGFLIPVVLHGFNGLHVYIPSVPSIQYRNFNISQYFTERPWSAMGYTTVSFYPCVIGISYILTLDVAFSGGFFYAFTKAEAILGAAVGWSGSSALARYPFLEEQGTGAFLAIAVFGLGFAWQHLRDIVRTAFVDARHVDDSSEPLSYRAAVFGWLGGMLFLIVWSTTAGMTLLAAATFFILFCLFTISLTRMRVQSGMGWIHGPLSVQDFMLATVGTANLGVTNLTVLSHYYFMTGEMRGLMSVMPAQLEGFKVAETVRIPPKHLVVGLLLGTFIGLLLAYFAALGTIHEFGGNILNNWRLRSMPTIPFQRLQSVLSQPRDPDWLGIQFVAVGFAITMFLIFIRRHFVWWMFHPIGYASAHTTRTVRWVWFAMLIGFLIKYLAFKHGGIRTYRKLLPLFLGLILGDFFMGGFWGVVGWFSDEPGYLFFP